MGKTIRRIFIVLIYFSVLATLIVFHEPINEYIVENYIYNKDVTKYVVNNYSKQTNYNYVQITENFKVTSKTELLNAIYTIIDSGIDEFTFYCEEEYENCIKDVEDLSNNTSSLTIINNYVDPYNSFNKLYIYTNNLGKVNIVIDKLYSKEEIDYTNSKMDAIISEVISPTMNERDKIKAFHDYIVNTTIYDEQRSEEIKNNIFNNNVFNSHKASGVLENHIALCSGYTDVMAVFLNRMKINNFKISNNDHIWNAIYLDNAWYHLDLTWDDPVTNTGENVLLYDFFLLTNYELLNKEAIQHAFDQSVYTEITAN